MSSRHLEARELRALNKIGDLMIPAGEGFPSFSATGCVEHVDDVAEYMDPRDRADFKLLLRVLGALPRPLLFLVLWLAGRGAWFPRFLGATLRLIDLGVRGVVYSLYYSNKTAPGYRGPKPHDVLGYEVRLRVG